MASSFVIDVHGLHKHFGTEHVVNDLSLQIRAGEIFGFLGPNGSGKTTSIRMLCGLLKPDSGSGTCLGLDVIRDSADIKRQVGYMTQRFSLWEDLSIEENLHFVARLFEMPDRQSVVQNTLKQLGLTQRKQQLAGTLSGGWKQRLSLAACLLHTPQLLLLDEPTAGVDPKARRDFWEEIHLLSRQGITVLVSTHYMDEAERCHRLGYMAEGRLLANGTAADIVAQQHLQTWKLTGTRVNEVSALLTQLPGVSQVTNFGAALHISGELSGDLQNALLPFTQSHGLQLHATSTSLEDAFIHLMRRKVLPTEVTA